MAYDNIFQARIEQLLSDNFYTYLGSVYGGRIYSPVPPVKPIYPIMVWQFPVSGGNNADTIGANGWVGDVAFRSLSTTKDEAFEKLIAAAALLNDIDDPDYHIKVYIKKPLPFPAEKQGTETIYTSAVQAQVEVYKK
jgi:hypothetical protein